MLKGANDPASNFFKVGNLNYCNMTCIYCAYKLCIRDFYKLGRYWNKPMIGPNAVQYNTLLNFSSLLLHLI